MRSITYLDAKNNPVHKQWFNDYAGVVVLHLAEGNLYIERTADIFKFLCDVRYGHINKGFIQKYNLGAASTVSTALKALERLELVIKDEENYLVHEVQLARWMARI